jgi:hypothetical protein
MEIASSAGYLQLLYGRDLRLRLLGFDVKGSWNGKEPIEMVQERRKPRKKTGDFASRSRGTCVAEEHKEPSMDTLGWIILGGLS